MYRNISNAWHRWLFRSSPALMVASALVFALLVALLDTSAGAAVSLAALYAIPVAAASWYGGVRAGAWLALACTLLSLAAVSSPDSSFVWLNGLIRLLSLSALAWLLAQVRAVSDHMMSQSKRKRAAEAQARESEYRRQSTLDAFLHNSPNLFCVCNREFVIYSIGSFWRDQLDGIDPTGRKFPEFLHPDDVGAAVVAFRSETSGPATFSARFHFREGGVHQIQFVVRASPDRQLYLVELSPANTGKKAPVLTKGALVRLR